MRPSWFVSVAIIALMLALVGQACGGAEPAALAPTRTPSTSPTSTSLPPTQTPTPSEVASSTPVPPMLTVEVVGSCNNPYPAGADIVSTPGEPILLRPLGAPPALSSYGYAVPASDGGLMDTVDSVLGNEAAHFAIVIKNLSDGSGMVLAPNREFYAASLYKTWVMVEAFNQQQAGLLDWAEQFTVSEHYETHGLNPGELQACDVVTLQSMIERALGRSDNVAANLLLDRVGGGNVNRALRSLGLARSGFYSSGTMPTTAAEMALLLEAIYGGAAVNEVASNQMLELLKLESVGNRIPALLPAGTAVAHKTGNWENATHDAGIVFSPEATYVIVVLTDYGYADGGAALIAELSRAVYDYYNGG